MEKVLFVCIHNSARSQMAETFLNALAGDKFTAESAGLEAGNLNPLAVEAMAEEGFDISNNSTDSVFDFHAEGRNYDYVVKVCDQSSAEACPTFPSEKLSLQWDFEDPSSFEGEWDEKLARTKKVRDQIKVKVLEFIEEYSQ